MNPKTRIALTTLRAALEAPWTPIRGHEWSSAPAICAARRDGGRGLLGGGGDSRRRKSDQRERDAATAFGLLEAGRLTAEGKRTVRGWSYPFSPPELIEALDRLADRVRLGDAETTPVGPLVPEQLICGVEWGDSIALLQVLFAPLLTDRVLIARSSNSGRASYGFAGAPPEDLAAVAADAIDFGVSFDPALGEMYPTLVRDLRRRAAANAEYFAEMGELPIVSKGLASGRDYFELDGIEPLFTGSAANG